MGDAKIVKRRAVEGDKSFILSTWLRGQYWNNDYYSKMDQDDFFKHYSEVINTLLGFQGVNTFCAVLEDSPDTIIGYMVFCCDVLYWSYVKKDYRKNGIFNMLAQDLELASTVSSTKVGDSICKKKHLKFNPFKLR